MRLDSLGTHLVENSIGIARQQSSDPRWRQILTAFAHSEVRKRIAARYGLKLSVSGRINDGGCKADTSDDRDWEHPPEWYTENIVNCLMVCCRDDLRQDEDVLFLESFSEKISTEFPCADVHEYDVNEAANSAIMARIIHFNVKQE